MSQKSCIQKYLFAKSTARVLERCKGTFYACLNFRKVPKKQLQTSGKLGNALSTPTECHKNKQIPFA